MAKQRTFIDRAFQFITWPKTIALLAINFALQASMLSLVYPMISTTADPLDIQLGLTAESVHVFFRSLNEFGAGIYLMNQLTADMAFPVAYSLAYAALLAQLIKGIKRDHTALKYVALVPFGIALFDVVENINISLYIASMIAGHASAGTSMLIVANSAKHAMTFLALGLLALLGAWRVVRAWRAN